MLNRPLVRYYSYLGFALLVIILSWESSVTAAAWTEPAIPQQSIRIRIVANSNSAPDQWIKREIREAIAARMNQQPLHANSVDEARASISGRLSEFGQEIDALLEQNGFRYGYRIELGMVPFPAKTYGNRTYPAGEYEALLITLGAGGGDNWWCVMFPPLCFVNGTVKAISATSPTAMSEGQQEMKSDTANDSVEYRFYVVEKGKQVASKVKKWLR